MLIVIESGSSKVAVNILKHEWSMDPVPGDDSRMLLKIDDGREIPLKKEEADNIMKKISKSQDFLVASSN